jgi:hypothetical protein
MFAGEYFGQRGETGFELNDFDGDSRSGRRSSGDSPHLRRHVLLREGLHARGAEEK